MTRYRSRFRRSVFRAKVTQIAASLFALTAVGWTAQLVTPTGGYELREGNSSGTWPFIFGQYDRVQQVISADEFYSVPGQLRITRMALREQTNGLAFTVYMSNQINLSTTARAPDALSALFVENVGPDETVVLPGDQLRGFGGTYLPGETTQPFYTIFDFTQPFLYGPYAGNLLVEIRSYAGLYLNPQGYPAQLDAVYQQGDGVSQLLGSSATSPTGAFWTGGYVIQFEYTLVPEPSSFVLLAAGLLGLLWFRQNRR